MIFKWAGGKKAIANKLIEIMNEVYDPGMVYIEPFLGSGAMFFRLAPEHAILADYNETLITTYRAIRSSPSKVIMHLRLLVTEYTDGRDQKDYYYVLRKKFNSENVDAYEYAARAIFMNRTCFNGLYRVNQKGLFNVPHGRYNNPFPDGDMPRRIARTCSALNKNTISLFFSDFERVIDSVPQDGPAFIYCDPPYHEGYDLYTKWGFTEDDQARLQQHCVDAVNADHHIMVSNSNTEFIRNLWFPWNIREIQAPRAINSDPNGRKPVTELVITSW